MDAWTAIHTTGSVYDVPRFRDDPTDARIDPEQTEVGDVTGKSLLHLQCHFGLDTLSWARLGAGHVTGVDFSEPAIAFARELAADTRLADRSRFIVSDIYDLPGPLAGETFDIVYTGGGALCWLPDLESWARIVAGFVKPGGIFYIYEVHPVLWAIDDDQDYWGGETISMPVEGLVRRSDGRRRRGGGAQLAPFARRGRGAAGEHRSSGRAVLDEKRELGYPVQFLIELGDERYGFSPTNARRSRSRTRCGRRPWW